jgi:hypothetical protein
MRCRLVPASGRLLPVAGTESHNGTLAGGTCNEDSHSGHSVNREEHQLDKEKAQRPPFTMR